MPAVFKRFRREQAGAGLDFLRLVVELATLAAALATGLRVYLIDFQRLIIEDEAILFLGILGGLQAFFFPIGGWPLQDYVYGSLALGGFFFAAYEISNRLYGGNAFGFGDVKLAFAIGLWISWQGVIFFLLTSAWSLLALIVLLASRRWQRGSGFRRPRLAPFGPGMIVAFFLIVGLNLAGFTVTYASPLNWLLPRILP